MAEHYQLEITNRTTKIKIWSGASENFANDYRKTLAGIDNESDDTSIDENNFDAPMTDDMAAIFSCTDMEIPEKHENPPKSKSKSIMKGSGKYAKYNYAKRIKNRASKFKSDAYINFAVPNVQFVTLTFDGRIFENADDLQTCTHAFQLFIKRVQRQYSDFKYVATFSRQNNRNWHFHMICNFDETVSGKTINELWSYGLTHNTVLTNNTELSTRISYCVDNMHKSAWEDLQGKNGYLHSRHLQNKILLRSWKDSEHELAEKYLNEILNSDFPPVQMSNVKVPQPLSAQEIKQEREKHPTGVISGTKLVDVGYWFSQKGYPELFEEPLVAKKKIKNKRKKSK